MSYSFWRPQPWRPGALSLCPLATPLLKSLVTLTKLTGRAVVTYEVTEATASVKFVGSVKI